MMIVCCLHAAIIMRVTAISILLLSFLSTVMEVCSQTVPYITFMGKNLPNNSYIILDQVGDADSTSVQCHTDLTTCCSMAQGDGRGDWYFPNGEKLPFSKHFSRQVFEHRQNKRVDLRRRKNPVTPRGIYRCDMQINSTSNDSWETVYVGLYKKTKRGKYMTYTHCVFTCVLHVIYK